MLSEILEDKLQYFDLKKYRIEDTNVLLEEREEQGKVSLMCTLDKETLIFPDPEKNVLPYLNEKKGSRSCPDKFLFQMDENGDWILHVMEFKKSINTDSLKTSKHQMVMGIYNARAIAGYLNIPIKQVYVYSAYRKDTLTKDNLAILRSANINPEDLRVMIDWNK